MNNTINEFWNTTWNVWKTGILSQFYPDLEKAAAVGFSEFIMTCTEVEHPAMKIFLSQFTPLPMEFLICFDDVNENKPSFVLTSQRLVVRKKEDYVSFMLSEITDFVLTGFWKVSLKLLMRNGESHVFSVHNTLSVEVLKFTIKEAHTNDAWRNIESKLSVSPVHETDGTLAVEGLLKVLDDKSSSYACKRKAAEALGKIGDPKAVEELLKALNDGKLNDEDNFRIQCIKCGRKYDLPVHAHCVTSFGTIADFGFVWGGEEARANWIRKAALNDNRNSPDLVSDEGQVPWEQRKKFLEEVECIKRLLSVGQIRWWKCWHCKELQKYKLIPIPMKILVTFQGKTLEEAKAVAREIMPKDIDFSIVTSDDVQLKTILAKGETSTIAVKTCYSLIPPNAFDISEVEISKIGQTDTIDLREYSQSKAYEALSIKMPTGRFIDKLSCNVRPKKGFLGFGRRKGTWRVHWFTYFEAKVTFKIPATVTVNTK
jgi:hypothetical protein